MIMLHLDISTSRRCWWRTGWHMRSLEPTDVGDTGAHGYIEGKLTGNGCQIRFVPHALREYRHCEVQVDKSVTGHVLRQKVADMIEEAGKAAHV